MISNLVFKVAVGSGGVVLNIRLINITIVNQTSVQTINIR